MKTISTILALILMPALVLVALSSAGCAESVSPAGETGDAQALVQDDGGPTNAGDAGLLSGDDGWQSAPTNVGDAGVLIADDASEPEQNTSGPIDGGSESATNAPNAPSACDPSAGTPVALADQNDEQQHLIGRWWRCSGDISVLHLGIEFASDGTWYDLVAGSTPDVLVRGTGLGSAGQWALSDCYGSGLAFGCQLSIYVSGGVWGGSPTFTTDPAKFGLNADNGSNLVFAAIP